MYRGHWATPRSFQSGKTGHKDIFHSHKRSFLLARPPSSRSEPGTVNWRFFSSDGMLAISFRFEIPASTFVLLTCGFLFDMYRGSQFPSNPSSLRSCAKFGGGFGKLLGKSEVRETGKLGSSSVSFVVFRSLYHNFTDPRAVLTAGRAKVESSTKIRTIKDNVHFS